MKRPPLPDFENPPVIEVALSIQFEELADFRSIHLGLLWLEFGRERFPGFEEQPPVQSSIEAIGAYKAKPLPKFQFVEVPPMPRYMFVSSDGTEVLQVQQDRFTVNWRKRKSEDKYPRFETLFSFFEKYVEVFQRFLTQYALGEIQINQAEVTYVNRIEHTTRSTKLSSILAVFSGSFSDPFLNEPEEAYMSFRFPMSDENRRLGSLYIDIRPETGGEEACPQKMVLLARGKPTSPNVAGVLDFFVLARKYIVSGFASITSKEAQQSWGRRDNAVTPKAGI